MLVNKLDAAWRRRVPNGIRPKITNIPFNGVMGKEIKAMGTKRVPVLANTLFAQGFAREFTTACFAMDNMAGRGYDPRIPNPSFDDRANPTYYKDPSDSFGQYDQSPRSANSNKLEKLRLQQELQDLRRERLSESHELQGLRERDLARKRIADGRKSYRAYVLDSSKESRGWLREVQGYNTAINDSLGMFR